MCFGRCGWGPLFRAAAVALLAALSSCRPTPSGTDAELRNALDETYPNGWRYASLRADLHSEMRAGDSPAWIQGDFDGDQLLDYAAQVVAFRPGHTYAVDSAQMLLAFLRRDGRFVRQVLSTGGGPHLGIFLSRIEAGERIQDFEGGPPIDLKADAIYQIFANEAGVAFVYDRGRWIELALSD